MSESTDNPYCVRIPEEPPAPAKFGRWWKTGWLCFWMFPNSLALITCFVSLSATVRSVYRGRVVAFGVLGAPIMLVALLAMILAVDRRNRRLLLWVSTPLLCMSLAWLAVMGGTQMYRPSDAFFFAIAATCWSAVNAVAIVRLIAVRYRQRT